MKLASGVMPPSNVGRKPKPLDPELTEALYEALSESTPEEVESEGFESKLYPAFFGPDFSELKHVFGKDFQAQGEGRKYAGPISKRIGKVVRVNVYHNGAVDPSGKPTEATRYTWRLYIPVSEYTEDELTAIAEVEDPAEVEPDSLEPSNLD